MIICESKVKAEVLNDQFFSIFTEEDASYFTYTGTWGLISCSFLAIPDVYFNVEGIYNPLNGINKSPSSDKIPSRILKCWTVEVAHIIATLK